MEADMGEMEEDVAEIEDDMVGEELRCKGGGVRIQ
jgi:hypothetical protein